MKRIISGVLIVLFTATLFAGCGSKTATSDNASSSSAAAGEKKEDVKKDGAAGKEVEVTFWRPQNDPPEQEFYKQKVEEFNKAYAGKIKLKMEEVTRGNSFAYEDKINASVASHTLPDIFLIDGPNLANYAYSKIVRPIDDLVEKDFVSSMVPSIIQQGTYDGKLYAIGQLESTVVLYVNKKMMAENGIEVPKTIDKAWTWDDWYNVMKKCAKPGIFGANGVNDKGEWMTYAFQQLWVSNGTDICSPDGKTAEGYVNGPKGIEAGQFLAKLAKEKLFNAAPTPTEFEDGKAATKLGGPWNIPSFQKKEGFEWDITYYPKSSNGGKVTSSSGRWCAAITTDSKVPKEAAQFIQWIYNKENDAALAKALSAPAANKASYDLLPEYNNRPLSLIKEQVVNVAHARPVTPAYPVLTQKFAEALLNILSGADVKTSLDNVAKTYDAEYKKNYSGK